MEAYFRRDLTGRPQETTRAKQEDEAIDHPAQIERVIRDFLFNYSCPFLNGFNIQNAKT